MSDTLEYKGYTSKVEYSAEDGCLVGKIEFINDLIMFDGESVSELVENFHSAVDSYLDICAEQKRSPDMPFKGSLNVRIGEDIHKKTAIQAKKAGVSINEFIKIALREKLESKTLSEFSKITAHRIINTNSSDFSIQQEEIYESVAHGVKPKKDFRHFRRH